MVLSYEFEIKFREITLIVRPVRQEILKFQAKILSLRIKASVSKKHSVGTETLNAIKNTKTACVTQRDDAL